MEDNFTKLLHLDASFRVCQTVGLRIFWKPRGLSMIKAIANMTASPAIGSCSFALQLKLLGQKVSTARAYIR
jgi:hypothetical protein